MMAATGIPAEQAGCHGRSPGMPPETPYCRPRRRESGPGRRGICRALRVFSHGQNSGVSSKTVLLDNHRRFLGFLEKRVGDRAAAEDLLQDAFVNNLDKEDAG